MKMTSRNNTRLILSALLCFLLPRTSQAQIIDWMADQVKNYVVGQVNSVLNSTTNNLGSFGTMLWDGIVEAGAVSEVTDKAKELANFETSTTELYNVPMKYGMSGDRSDFSTIYKVQNSFMRSVIFSQKGLHLSTLGKGAVGNLGKSIVASVNEANKIESLESVLDKSVRDSVALFVPAYPNIKEMLLNDLHQHNEMIIILNNHPEAVRVYANSMEMEGLRTSPEHLLYWSVQADRHRELLPQKKANLPDPRMLVFKKSGLETHINYNGTTLGIITPEGTIRCQTLDLLNFCAKPNTKYEFLNQKYQTDNLGRVVIIIQQQNESTKGKCKIKTKLKPTDFAPIQATEAIAQLYQPASPKYQGAPVLLNAYYYEKTKNNKQVLKEVKKAEKMLWKTFGSVVLNTTLSYSEGMTIPYAIKITHEKGSGEFTLTNPITIVYPSRQYEAKEKEAEKKFLQTLTDDNNLSTSYDYSLPKMSVNTSTTTKVSEGVKQETSTVNNTNSLSSSDKETLKKLSEEWSDTRNTRSTSPLNRLFADKVNFYQTTMTRSECIERIKKMMSKYPNYQQEVCDFTYSEMGTNRIKVHFSKIVWVNGKGESSTTYPSYLIFTKKNGTWKIETESDDVTDRNLAKKKKK